MRNVHCHRSAAAALILSCLTAAACQRDEPKASTETATATPTPSASAADLEDPCTIPSASAAHVAQALGTGKLTGPTLHTTSITQKCQYHGAEKLSDTVAIELDLTATSLDFDSARRMVEQYLKGPTSDVPGFGDKAFSHVSTTDLGKVKVVVNTLCVLKGKTLVIISSQAPFEKIRALETDVLRDLGA